MYDAASPLTRDPRLDAIRSAHDAGLRYVDERDAVIVRKRHGKGFRYVDAEGKTVRDRDTLARIRALVIPPAWTSVTICADPDGHIQATGRDAKGRKQYRYHPEFRAIRDETKYEKIFDFAGVLPRLRAQVEADLAKKDLTREKVLAAIVALLDSTLIRVGNEEYARLNESFGLTTLRKRHARVKGHTIEFRFRGKSGVERNVRVVDRRIAKVLQRCQGLRGELLFRYRTPDGQITGVDSSDVNAYVRACTGEDFTAKDFRTWAGTVIAAVSLAEHGPSASRAAAKRAIAAAVRHTSTRLGNTPTVCRKSYVHPAVLASYLAGDVLSPTGPLETGRVRGALRTDEEAVLAFLARVTERQRRAASRARRVTTKSRGSVSRKTKSSVRGGGTFVGSGIVGMSSSGTSGSGVGAFGPNA